VKTVNVLPKAVEPPDFFKLAKLDPLILKIARETFTPAKIATANVKLKDVTRYAGPIISAAAEKGTREIVE